MNFSHDLWRANSFHERGPIPIHRFLDYLPTPKNSVPQDIDFSHYGMEQFGENLPECLARTFSQSEMLQDFEMHSINDPSYPDVLLSSQRQSESFTWEHLEMGIKVVPLQGETTTAIDQMAKKTDPFIGGKTKHTCESLNFRRDNQESNQLLNTLIALAGSQLWAQHRNFIFSVVIRGRYARFMRWDRFGVVFSDDLNYHENSMLFSFFWWKFGSANPEERGWDTSVTIATWLEKDLYTGVVRTCLEEMAQGKRTRIHGLHHSLAEDSDQRTPAYPSFDFPTWKVRVGDSQYLLRAPFTEYNPWGCATHGYYVIDIVDPKNLLFMKDSWRPPRYDSELCILNEWRKHDLHNHPHLPSLRCAEDVMFSDRVRVQETRTQETQIGATLEHGNSDSFIHHRVVGEIVHPLQFVPSSKDVVQAVRDGIIGLSAVFSTTGRIHADFSPSNIMVKVTKSGEISGVLNDWDKTVLRGKEVTFRTKTTASLKTMENIERKGSHRPIILDDLESSFWSLLFTLSFNFKHTGEIKSNIFDASADKIRFEKSRFLAEIDDDDICFESSPLNTLISELRDFWFDISMIASSSDGRAGIAAVEKRIIQTRGQELTAMFDKALSMDGWVMWDRQDNIYDMFTMRKQDPELKVQSQSRERSQSSHPSLYLSESSYGYLPVSWEDDHISGSVDAVQDKTGCLGASHVPKSAAEELSGPAPGTEHAEENSLAILNLPSETHNEPMARSNAVELPASRSPSVPLKLVETGPVESQDHGTPPGRNESPEEEPERPRKRRRFHLHNSDEDRYVAAMLYVFTFAMTPHPGLLSVDADEPEVEVGDKKDPKKSRLRRKRKREVIASGTENIP